MPKKRYNAEEIIHKRTFEALKNPDPKIGDRLSQYVRTYTLPERRPGACPAEHRHR